MNNIVVPGLNGFIRKLNGQFFHYTPVLRLTLKCVTSYGANSR